MLLFTYVLRILLANFCFHSVLRLGDEASLWCPAAKHLSSLSQKGIFISFFFIFARENNLEVISKIILSESK